MWKRPNTALDGANEVLMHYESPLRRVRTCRDTYIKTDTEMLT